MVKRYLTPIVILIIAIIGFILLGGKESNVRRPAEQSVQSKVTNTSNRPVDGNKQPISVQNQDNQTSLKDNASSQNSDQQQAPGRNRSGGFSGRGGLFGQTNAATVSLLKVEKSSWAPELNLFGRVVSDQKLDIASQHNSTVKQILVTSGMRVEISQLVMTLDNRELLVTRRQTASRIDDIDARIRLQKLQQDSDTENLRIEEKILDISQKTLDRYENLSSQQLSSSTDYETALKSYQNQLMQVQNRKLALSRYTDTMAQLNAQKSELSATLENIDALLEETQILAPFNGVVASVAVAEGNQVSQNAPLLTIYNPESLGVVSRVPVKWLPLLTNQEQLVSASTTLSEQNYNLKLSSVDSITSQGSIQVKFQFVDAPAVALGQHIALTATLPSLDNVYAIPANVLYEGQLVFRVISGKLQGVPVSSLGQLQKDGDTWYLVKSEHLANSELLLNTRLPNASTGLNVNVAKENQGL